MNICIESIICVNDKEMHHTIQLKDQKLRMNQLVSLDVMSLFNNIFITY